MICDSAAMYMAAEDTASISLLPTNLFQIREQWSPEQALYCREFTLFTYTHTCLQGKIRAPGWHVCREWEDIKIAKGETHTVKVGTCKLDMEKSQNQTGSQSIPVAQPRNVSART